MTFNQWLNWYKSNNSFCTTETLLYLCWEAGQQSVIDMFPTYTECDIACIAGSLGDPHTIFMNGTKFVNYHIKTQLDKLKKGNT